MMFDQTVTLHLPDTIMRRAQCATDVLQRSLEDILAATLAAALPDVDNAPPEMWAELTRMTWFSDQMLWKIAQSTMPTVQQEQMRSLAEAQAKRPLTEDEKKTLDALRREYGRVTLRKSHSYALLSLRGGRLVSPTGVTT